MPSRECIQSSGRISVTTLAATSNVSQTPIHAIAASDSSTSFCHSRSGEVQGDRPWSVIKIGLAVIAGAIAVGTIGYFYAQGQGGFEEPVIQWNQYNY